VKRGRIGREIAAESSRSPGGGPVGGCPAGAARPDDPAWRQRPRAAVRRDRPRPRGGVRAADRPVAVAAGRHGPDRRWEHGAIACPDRAHSGRPVRKPERGPWRISVSHGPDGRRIEQSDRFREPERIARSESFAERQRVRNIIGSCRRIAAARADPPANAAPDADATAADRDAVPDAASHARADPPTNAAPDADAVDVANSFEDACGHAAAVTDTAARRPDADTPAFAAHAPARGLADALTLRSRLSRVSGLSVSFLTVAIVVAISPVVCPAQAASRSRSPLDPSER
jgi:hypothetical protein